MNLREELAVELQSLVKTDRVQAIVLAWAYELLREQREGIAQKIEEIAINADGEGVELYATAIRDISAAYARHYNPELERRMKGE